MTPEGGRTFVLWLDRDGTLVDDPGYLDDPAELRLLPGAAKALARLNRAGALVVLVTNQSGIGRGYMTLETVERIHERLREKLGEEGAHLDHIEFCPHLPPELLPASASPCDCRKPLPGMVLRARVQLGLQASRLPEFVVGDKSADIELAAAVGARGVLVQTGDGAAAGPELRGRASFVAEDLPAAADWILARLGADA